MIVNLKQDMEIVVLIKTIEIKKCYIHWYISNSEVIGRPHHEMFKRNVFMWLFVVTIVYGFASFFSCLFCGIVCGQHIDPPSAQTNEQTNQNSMCLVRYLFSPIDSAKKETKNVISWIMTLEKYFSMIIIQFNPHTIHLNWIHKWKPKKGKSGGSFFPLALHNAFWTEDVSRNGWNKQNK